MNGKQAKFLRKKAKRFAAKEQEKLIPEFKQFVNTQLNSGERFILAWRLMRKRF